MTVPTSNPMLPSPARILEVAHETADTITIRLEPPGGDGFRFAPGQFNMIYLYGVGEVAISISGDPAATSEIVHTIRAIGSVTRAIASAARRGRTLGVRGPYGRGWPVDRARGGDVVLVAGGLGLAPLRSVVHHLLRHREQYREVALLVGARTPDDLIFRRELLRWRREGRIRTAITVDRAAPDWNGRVGVVPSLLADARFQAERTIAFVCGPEVMMRFTERELARLGVGADRLYLALERNMKCALGLCGRCQLGPAFVCKDGPVHRYDALLPFFTTREA